MEFYCSGLVYRQKTEVVLKDLVKLMFHTPWVNCSLVFSRYDPRKGVLALIHCLITRGQNARHEKLQNLGENEVGIPKSIQSSHGSLCLSQEVTRHPRLLHGTEP